ncbi:uncharacterized protein LOC127365013 [Dicentrarchus labrax]|uniref:uncharacterized protein LOC127365013 n=1 Tax=Dicentrarchus labrax TaxID=13489 RepID=UPI0021F673CB|nr:uncharacterized protein LOC127365013 [Dicentrarchus labrax]
MWSLVRFNLNTSSACRSFSLNFYFLLSPYIILAPFLAKLKLQFRVNFLRARNKTKQQILTTGGMEGLAKYLGFNRTLSLICCTFWIFSPTEGTTISKVVGNRVVLHCDTEPNNKLTQLTWKMNGVNLFSFSPRKPLHTSDKAYNLSINMSLNNSESPQYALIIERVQTSHSGNYTCEKTSNDGPYSKHWELIITELVEEENLYMIVIAVAVPCVCFLIFIIVLTILHRVCKPCAGNSTHPPTTAEEQTEDIYENCLEMFPERRGYNHSCHFNP